MRSGFSRNCDFTLIWSGRVAQVVELTLSVCWCDWGFVLAEVPGCGALYYYTECVCLCDWGFEVPGCWQYSLFCPCRFVAKVRSLDPSYRDVVPWQPRGYKRKRRREGQSTEPAKEASGPQIKRLYSPLLAEEEKVSVLKHDTDWLTLDICTPINNTLQ